MFFTVTAPHAKKFLSDFDAEIKKMEKYSEDVFKGFAAAAFNFVLRETPEWTGNAASNWNFDLGFPSYIATVRWKAVKPGVPWSKIRPNTAAIQEAVSRPAGKLSGVKLSSSVYINNAAFDPFSGELYIQMLETNPRGYLRPDNEPGAMAARAQLRFEGILSDMLPHQAEALRGVKIGFLNNGGLL